MNGRIRLIAVALILMLLAACGSTPQRTVATAPVVATPNRSALDTVATGKPAPVLPKANSGRGAYYKDDGPGDNPPPGLELTLDAEPKVEPYSASGNKPYVVFGKTYTPMLDDKPFTERGIGSWYGKKFHGQKTSSGELYDMYKMTAAHPTLPIPSYARITNLANGKQVIVKINDRGPFHTNRIVDLSYTAALKLDYLGRGSSELLLERLLPADIEKMAENRKNLPPPVQTAAVAVPASPPATTLPAPVPVPVPAPDNAAYEALLAKSSVADQAPPIVTIPTAAPVSEQESNAAPIRTEPAAPVIVPVVTTAPNAATGLYLQFGAFGLRSNAEATFAHLQARLAELPAFEIVQQGTLYRLFSGPFPNRDAATDAVALALKIGLPKPIIVQR